MRGPGRRSIPGRCRQKQGAKYQCRNGQAYVFSSIGLLVLTSVRRRALRMKPDMQLADLLGEILVRPIDDRVGNDRLDGQGAYPGWGNAQRRIPFDQLRG